MKFFNRLLLTIIIIMSFTAVSNINAEPLTKDQVNTMMSKFLESGNAGKEFLITAHPMWSDYGMGRLIIYISSPYKTNVKLTIPGLKQTETKSTIPNDIIQFMLSESDGGMYAKTDREAPQPAQVWKDRAVLIESEAPIMCYVVFRESYTGEGYLALPKHALGKRYVVSAYADPTLDNGIQYLNSFTSIIAAYDSTKVEFTLGGSDNTYVLQKNGETLSGDSINNHAEQTMNKGDVWLIPSMGDYNDLSGSVVQASKPVALISGNFCTYIPFAIGGCDYTIEQELPVKSWGTKYHIAPIIKRTKASMIKVYAAEENTQLYKNGEEWEFLTKSGGKENQGGIIHERAVHENEGVKPVTVSSDKPINITQYNTGYSDDKVPSDPFQMVLIPVEQYQTEIEFITPGVSYSQDIYRENYINLIYLATEDGTIPEDLEFGHYQTNEFKWQKIADMEGDAGLKFGDSELDDSGRYYYSKILTLKDPAGVFRIRGKDPFAAYAYGFGDYTAYGYPASIGSRNIDVSDTLAPRVEFESKYSGMLISGKVIDEPEFDPEKRANLRYVYLDSETSYNYQWKESKDPDFISSVDSIVNWDLEVINPFKQAEAYIVCIDDAGNTHVEHFKYYSIADLLIRKNNDDWSYICRSMEPETKSFSLINNQDKDIYTGNLKIKLIFKDLTEKKKYHGFNIDTVSIDLTSTILANEERNFQITFDPSIGKGRFVDSLGIEITNGDVTIYSEYLINVRAEVVNPCIEVEDVNFGNTRIGSTSEIREVKIFNPSPEKLIIDKYSKFWDGNSFNEKGTITYISTRSPMEINANDSATFFIEFSPQEEKVYEGKIYFYSNSGEIGSEIQIDPYCRLTGEGILPDNVEENSDHSINKVFSLVINPSPIDNKPGLIEYEIGVDNIHTVLSIYGVRGNLIAELINSDQTYGKHSIELPELNSGTYFCKMQAGKYIKIRKIFVEK